jgi:hypothetical protein
VAREVSAAEKSFLPVACASPLHERQITSELDARGYTYAGRSKEIEELETLLTETAMRHFKAYGVLTAIGGSWVFSLTRDAITEAMRLHR